MRTRSLSAALVLVAVAGLGACSSSASSNPATTPLQLTPTNYAVQPTVPATTIPLIPTTPPAAGAVVAGEGTTYTTVAGDYPSTIAKKFKVKFTDLMAINNWTLVGQNVPEFKIGVEIKIPPGYTVPGATAATPAPGGTTAPADTSAPAATTADTGTTVTATTTASTKACPPAGTYTIVAGDLPSTVAKKFDVTVDQLNAANTATKGYKNFVVGVKIIIPKKTC